MAELKTIPTRASVDKFLRGITDEKKRADCYQLLEIMKKATRAEPKMWGTSVVGFGKYHSTVPSGKEADWFLTGFSPCKQNLTLYMMGGFDPLDASLKNLGKYSNGKDCICINRLEDVDLKILKKLISQSVRRIARPKIKAGLTR